MKKSFILYDDALDILDHLTDEQSGKLFKAIRDYNRGIEIDLDTLLNVAFTPIRNHLERDAEAYEKRIKANRENGLKGGRPPKPKKPTGLIGNRIKAKKADNDNDNVSDTDSVSDNENYSDTDSDNKNKTNTDAHSRFDEFWKLYPKKTGKLAAQKAWDKAKISKDTFLLIIAAVEKAKKSQSWIKDNGQYIPNPATWLNQGRWMDEETEVHNDGLSDAGRRTLAACQRVFGS